MTAVATHPSTSRTTRAPSWGPTIARLAFGVILGFNAVLKWLPGYRSSFISDLQGAAQGQPSWLHGWFHFWIKVNQSSPSLFATLTGLAETAIAIAVLFGVARRGGYILGAVYMAFVWAVGEGFGGPYTSGATDPASGIVYVAFFIALLALSPAARNDRWSLDASLVRRISWWRLVAEPHAADRVADR
jgi:uncharacterized membrane protein YphA (DoxX/SURF4 family)